MTISAGSTAQQHELAEDQGLHQGDAVVHAANPGILENGGAVEGQRAEADPEIRHDRGILDQFAPQALAAGRPGGGVCHCSGAPYAG